MINRASDVANATVLETFRGRLPIRMLVAEGKCLASRINSHQWWASFIIGNFEQRHFCLLDHRCDTLPLSLLT